MLGRQHRRQGDPARRDLHPGGHGPASRLRARARRHGPVLGEQQRPRLSRDAPGRGFPPARGRLRPHLRRPPRRQRRVLGERRRGSVEPAGAGLRRGQRGRAPHLRPAPERHGRVLGRQRPRAQPGDRASGRLRPGRSRLGPQLRAARRHDPRLLGRRRPGAGVAAGPGLCGRRGGRQRDQPRVQLRRGRAGSAPLLGRQCADPVRPTARQRRRRLRGPGRQLPVDGEHGHAGHLRRSRDALHERPRLRRRQLLRRPRGRRRRRRRRRLRQLSRRAEPGPVRSRRRRRGGRLRPARSRHHLRGRGSRRRRRWPAR